MRIHVYCTYLYMYNFEILALYMCMYMCIISHTPLSSELGAPSRAVLIPSSEGEVFSEEPMDAPGATVEVVASTTTAMTPLSPVEQRSGGTRKKNTPDYRTDLLLRYIAVCVCVCVCVCVASVTVVHGYTRICTCTCPCMATSDTVHNFTVYLQSSNN